MILNAYRYLLFKENYERNNFKKMTWYHFIVSIVDAVNEEWFREKGRGIPPVADNRGDHQNLPGRSENTCWVCSTQ